MSWSMSWSMSWVDEFGCRQAVVDQLSPVSPVDQLSRSMSCQVDELSVDEYSSRQEVTFAGQSVSYTCKRFIRLAGEVDNFSIKWFSQKLSNMGPVR
jgi:hypothetical protein